MLVSANEAGRDCDLEVAEYADPAASVLEHETGADESSLDAANGEPSLIAALTAIQERYHYLPHHALVLLGETLDIPLSQIYGVATFYHAFSLKPRGAHLVRICMGTACHVRGAPQILDRFETRLNVHAGETTRDRRITLETVNCLGACALGPITVVDDQYNGQMEISKVDRLIKNLGRSNGGEGGRK
jgi:NADH-quinone oxidoreductase subunit E